MLATEGHFSEQQPQIFHFIGLRGTVFWIWVVPINQPGELKDKTTVQAKIRDSLSGSK